MDRLILIHGLIIFLMYQILFGIGERLAEGFLPVTINIHVLTPRIIQHFSSIVCEVNETVFSFV